MGNASMHQGGPEGNPEPADFEPTRNLADDSGGRAFAPTEISADAAVAADWWSESTDGQCSENAALFAASQPAPLSVV